MGMKREEFMNYAEWEIDDMFRRQKNRIINLIEQAWAEEKRNAEIDSVTSIMKGIMINLVEQAWLEGKRDSEIDNIASFAKSIIMKLSEEKEQETYEGIDGKMYPKDW